MRERLLELREIVIDTARETDDVVGFGEAPRWGEPRFISLPNDELRMCISPSLTYHKRKHLDLLGA